MPETAGQAAVLADPKEPASIARAIVAAIGPDRDRLRDLGLRRVGQFSRGATAAATLECAARSPRGGGRHKDPRHGGAGFIGSHTCDRLRTG
jgi:hypothetical protein